MKKILFFLLFISVFAQAQIKVQNLRHINALQNAGNYYYVLVDTIGPQGTRIMRSDSFSMLLPVVNWGLKGNANTTPGTNFLGTTDNQALVFKVNNVFSGKIGTTADSNLFLGYRDGIASTSTTANVCIGVGACATANGGTDKWNVAVGDRASGAGSNFTTSVAIGYAAGENNANFGNTDIGYMAGNNCSTGFGNTNVGRSTGNGNTGGSRNINIGDRAGPISMGSANTNVGAENVPSLTSGSGNTTVGQGIDVRLGTIANSSALGDSVLIRNSNGIYLGLRDTALYLSNMCFVKDSVTGGSTPVHNYAYPTAGQTLIFYGKNKGFGFGSSGSAYTADESSLHLAGGVFSIKSTYVGQASITTLGTIGTGAWQGTVVGPTYGGTGVNNAGTITNATNTTITGGGTLALGGFTLTVPATGTAVLGTGAANQIAWWSGTNTTKSDATLTYDGTNAQIGNSSGTAVSIGTAPPTTSTATQLFIGGNMTTLANNSASGESEFGLSYYYNSGFKYRFASSKPARLVFNGDATNFDMTFETVAATGAANAACTFVEKMRFTNGGKLGIGNNNPTYQLDVKSGDVGIATAGNTLRINTSSNGCMGTGTLNGSGTVVISTTCVGTGSAGIFITDTDATIGNTGYLSVGTIVNNTSFAVNSSNVTDGSTFNWVIFKTY